MGGQHWRPPTGTGSRESTLRESTRPGSRESTPPSSRERASPGSRESMPALYRRLVHEAYFRRVPLPLHIPRFLPYLGSYHTFPRSGKSLLTTASVDAPVETSYLRYMIHLFMWL